MDVLIFLHRLRFLYLEQCPKNYKFGSPFFWLLSLLPTATDKKSDICCIQTRILNDDNKKYLAKIQTWQQLQLRLCICPKKALFDNSLKKFQTLFQYIFYCKS